jgi:hypothetical protein
MSAAEFSFNIRVNVAELFGWQKHEYKAFKLYQFSKIE